MDHERVQELALDAAAFKAGVTSALESLARRMEMLSKEVKDMQGVTQGIKLEAARMVACAEYTAEILEKHTLEDMTIANEFRKDIRALQTTIWKAAGGLGALVALASLVGPKLLEFLK